ncbi:DUF1592 domain-containing protein, partial [Singulisphaera rosea]
VPEVKNLAAKGVDAGSQPFVLWKNRELAANRRRYAGGSAKIAIDTLGLSGAALQALEPPKGSEENAHYEAGFERFCRTFPDAFLVSERARIYLNSDEDKNNTGRLLSAGFHSMTGYFRDDGPLYDLVLDESGQRELDRLWREFQFITDAPSRQYSSYLWYERAESRFLKDEPDFDFVRAEDKDATSEAKMGRFESAYLAKARRLKASDEALRAIEDHFTNIARDIRQVERDRVEAEPRQLEALQRLAERAYRRPLSDSERRGIVDFYKALREQ